MLGLGDEGPGVANGSVSVVLFSFLMPKVSVHSGENREHLLHFVVISLDTK